MKKGYYRYGWLLVFLLFPACCGAQALQISGSVQQVVFTLPQGVIIISLPSGIAGGDIITASILIKPNGPGRMAKKNMAILNNFRLAAAEEQQLLGLSRLFDFRIPIPVPYLFHLIIKDSLGTTVQQQRVVTGSGDISTSSSLATDQRLYFPDENIILLTPYPIHQRKVRYSIKNGQDEKPLQVIAASSHHTILQAPTRTIGACILQVKNDSGKLIAGLPSQLVELKIIVSKTRLRKDEQMDLGIEVEGLQGYTYFPVFIEIINKTPDVVDYMGSPREKAGISSKDIDHSNGKVTLVRNLIALRDGSFKISVSLQRGTDSPVIWTAAGRQDGGFVVR